MPNDNEDSFSRLAELLNTMQNERQRVNPPAQPANPPAAAPVTPPLTEPAIRFVSRPSGRPISNRPRITVDWNHTGTFQDIPLTFTTMPSEPPVGENVPQTNNNGTQLECVSCFKAYPEAGMHTFYVAAWGIGPMTANDLANAVDRPHGLSPRFCCNQCWCRFCNLPVSKAGNRFLALGEPDPNNTGIADVRCTHAWCKAHGRGSHFKECRGCGNCNAVCDCFTCITCNENRSGRDYRVCERCNQGTCCCHCYQCGACRVWYTHREGNCGDCNTCQACCECSMRYSSVILSPHDTRPTFHHSKRNKGRFIAAELEVAGSNPDNAYLINETLEHWKAVAVRDGSLPAEGYEINTAPAKDESFDNQIIEICDTLTKANAYFTKKCGLHIHLDARDVNYYDLRKILQVYWYIESDLFKMVAGNRQDNRYCIPVKRHQGWSDVLFRKMSNKEWRDAVTAKMYSFKHDPTNKRSQNGFRRKKYSDARYFALNLHSWFFRKTIEFRHHQGSLNKTKIINWARICESIVEYALKSSEKDIKAQFTTNPEPLASILSPTLKDYYHARARYFSLQPNDEEQRP